MSSGIFVREKLEIGLVGPCRGNLDVCRVCLELVIEVGLDLKTGCLGRIPWPVSLARDGLEPAYFEAWIWLLGLDLNQ